MSHNEGNDSGKATQQDHWQPPLLQEAAIRRLDEQLIADPENISLHFERACLYAESGRTTEAKTAYINLLMKDPAHLGALNNLGTLLYRTGYRTAAQTAYTQAIATHPNDPMGHVNLANLLMENYEWLSARRHYETALQLDPNHVQAHQGLSYVLMELGDEQGAIDHRQKGFQDHAIISLPYYGHDTSLPILLLVSAVGGNTPTRWLLDDHHLQQYVVVAEFWTPTMKLPVHQLVFNAISDADLATPALIAANALLTHTVAPVINSPTAVLHTTRAEITQRFRQLPGIVVPQTVLFSRATLEAPDALSILTQHEFTFPFLLRSPGFHTGRHFLLVKNSTEFTAALADLPGAELLVIEYLDARDTDGNVRKYRVMMIDGQLYPLHLAISTNWKVHYFTAEMANQPAYRAQEAEFLNNMQQVIGARAMGALARIQAELGLDYAGIDFSVNANGDVLLFEANATMVVIPPESGATQDYRRPAVDRVFQAVAHIIEERGERYDDENKPLASQHFYTELLDNDSCHRKKRLTDE